MDIKQAISEHLILRFKYSSHERFVLPMAFGNHITTKNKVLRGKQVAGSSTTGNFDKPRLWIVDNISELRVTDEKFEIPSYYKKGDNDISPIDAEL